MFKLNLKVLEDELPKDLVADWEWPRAWAPQPLIDFWSETLQVAQQHPRLTHLDVNPDALAIWPMPEEVEVDVFLCSREAFEDVSDTTGALGCILLQTADFDPFGEDAPYPRKYRVLIVSDKKELFEHTVEEAKLDITPNRYLLSYIESYLATVFHEIMHAVLFAQNASGASPQDVDSSNASGEFHNDIFDCATGYGIRSLTVDGEEIMANDMEEASDLSERYVEAEGHKIMHHTLAKGPGIARFMAIAGIEFEDLG